MMDSGCGYIEGEVYTTIIIRDRASLHQCYCRYSQQYMTRSNCVRWPQFEERGMQLLGVVNQPPPHDVWIGSWGRSSRVATLHTASFVCV